MESPSHNVDTVWSTCQSTYHPHTSKGTVGFPHSDLLPSDINYQCIGCNEALSTTGIFYTPTTTSALWRYVYSKNRKKLIPEKGSKAKPLTISFYKVLWWCVESCEILQFQVTTATNCRALTCCMNVTSKQPSASMKNGVFWVVTPCEPRRHHSS
jgi:hypothetical protein